MPVSHKPRKRFVPKHGHLSALHLIENAQHQQQRARLSRSTDPLDGRQVRDLALYCHSALDAIRTGAGNDDHANHLALATNVALLLCEAGLGADWIDQVLLAQDAMVTLAARRNRIGRYVLSGVELQRLEALLDLHDAQLASDDCTEGLMMRALTEIKARVAAGNTIQLAA